MINRIKKGSKEDKVLGGLFGLAVGDALGVPVEFTPRGELKRQPVTDMIGGGTHGQPPGTWSDDSSLAFCLAESLCRGFDLHDIAHKFCRWLDEGYWTPYGEAFDVGGTTEEAISRLKEGVNPVEAGGRHEFSNGNGSLMRILPLAYYVEKMSQEEQFELTHRVSCLTHGHPRSQMACGMYIRYAINLLRGQEPEEAYKGMSTEAIKYYSRLPYRCELPHFSRILEANIQKLPEESIKSSGYVIDTLEASLWCFLNSKSYEETVLKAVNLGDDADTTGAVVGGIAGIYYGLVSIPKCWINTVAKKDDIIDLARRFCKCVSGF
ncbi:MAG TPA: ADP-ribosylglycohydrolase family protein [Candidatus Saccharicenans sp.]|nr:ADP-ribosylglycohydrolase family protein [Candidatus Saccharicenans sp.]HUM78848.1 ADP-ribosylglycohydrolase family protein [Candidatus Saccharicenans sp.]